MYKSLSRKEMHYGIVLTSRSISWKLRMMARGFRAPTGPPRPPELPDPWEFGFVVSESTVSYIPSTAQNHTTFSLVSYLDHDFLVQLFVFLGVSTIKKKKIKNDWVSVSGIYFYYYQQKNMVCFLYIWWITVN